MAKLRQQPSRWKPLSTKQRIAVSKLVPRMDDPEFLDMIAAECKRRTPKQRAMAMSVGFAQIDLIARGLIAYPHG